MSEANQPFAGSGSPETMGGQKPTAHDEHLPTTRLPPISAPPPGNRGSVRPPGPTLGPSTPLAPTVEREPPLADPVRGRSAARVLSPQERAAQEERIVRLSIGGVSAGLGLALAVSGLIVGLIVGVRGVAMDGSLAPPLAVALVITRGLMVLGMLAFGCGLIFFATRLLLGRGGSVDPGPVR